MTQKKSARKVPAARRRKTPSKSTRRAPTTKARKPINIADAPPPTEEERQAARPKQADILIHLAETAELFHESDGTAFASLTINNHRESWPVKSRGFRQWLAREYYGATGSAANSDAFASALAVIEARAHFDGAQIDTHIRVAEFNNKIYLDICDDAWRAVEVDETGWRVVDTPPVRFRRSKGMKAIVVPVVGGSIADLRTFLNLETDMDFQLFVACLLAWLRPSGPYPVIVVAGEQGSAKSSLSRVLRSLIDPSTTPLRTLPREERDLFIAARNGHVLCFDNVSGLPPWMSDAICRLATGGGQSMRQLYEDTEEVLFESTRPVLLNGITDIVTRPDLADRAVFLTLQPIAEDKRKPEAAFWNDFDAASPRILGALLTGISTGLRLLPSITLPRLPRMADFALWGAACETAFWPRGTFMMAYRQNQSEAVEKMIEASPVALAVRLFMDRKREWRGSATELLSHLNQLANFDVNKAHGLDSRSSYWPKNARALSAALKRAATPLRQTGINIAFPKESGNDRNLSIIRTEQPQQEAKPAEPAAPDESPSEEEGDFAPLAPFAPSLNEISAFGEGQTEGQNRRKGQNPSRGANRSRPPKFAPSRKPLISKGNPSKKGQRGKRGKSRPTSGRGAAGRV